MSEHITPLQLYPSDNTAEQLLVDQYFLNGRIINELTPFTQGSGDGAMEITDKEKAKGVLELLIQDAMSDLEVKFPNMNEQNRKQVAEKVILRAFSTYVPEGQEAEELLTLLDISSKSREQLKNALKSWNIEDSFNK